MAAFRMTSLSVAKVLTAGAGLALGLSRIKESFQSGARPQYRKKTWSLLGWFNPENWASCGGSGCGGAEDTVRATEQTDIWSDGRFVLLIIYKGNGYRRCNKSYGNER